MVAWSALLIGLRRALVYWQVLLMLLLGSLFTAGSLALLPGLALIPLANRPVLAEIAAGVEARHLVDLFGGLLQSQSAVLRGGEPGAPPGGVVGGLLSLTFSVVLLPLLGGVVSAFLYGGTLQTYHLAPEPFHWGRFLAACWRWFPGFLLMALLQAGLFLLLVVPPALLLFTLLSGAWNWGAWLAAALVLMVLGAWLTLFELARVQMVAIDTRNPFRGLGRAFSLIFRFPASIFGFYVLALLLLLFVHLLFRFGLLPITPLAVLPLALLVQQAFILARLFVRAVRLAGLAALAKA
jgi:hypothetical protein